MRRLLLLAAAIVAFGAQPALAEDSAATACGRIRAYTPATATTDGRITIGTRSLTLRADAVYSRMAQNTALLAVGNAICLSGIVSGGAFTQYVAIAMPSPFCGQVVAYAFGESIALRDTGTATFPVDADADLGSISVGQRVCVTVRINANGDATASARSLTPTDRAAGRVSWCGRVTAWTAPARTSNASLIHEGPGSITVGSRTFAIAARTTYSLINQPPIVGEPTCLSGLFDASGALVQYGAQPGMPQCIGGSVARYVPPTATTGGELKLAVSGTPAFTEESHRFAIPAGTRMPADADSGRYCFALALDAGGDAIVVGARAAEGGGVASLGAGASDGATVRTLPSTSTDGEEKVAERTPGYVHDPGVPPRRQKSRPAPLPSRSTTRPFESSPPSVA